MGASYHVGGIREEDEEFKRMVAVGIACHQAKVELPMAVSNYFGNEFSPLDPAKCLEVEVPFTENTTSYSHIWEVDISRIPKGVKKIRFEISH